MTNYLTIDEFKTKFKAISSILNDFCQTYSSFRVKYDKYDFEKDCKANKELFNHFLNEILSFNDSFSSILTNDCQQLEAKIDQIKDNFDEEDLLKPGQSSKKPKDDKSVIKQLKKEKNEFKDENKKLINEIYKSIKEINNLKSAKTELEVKNKKLTDSNTLLESDKRILEKDKKDLQSDYDKLTAKYNNLDKDFRKYIENANKAKKGTTQADYLELVNKNAEISRRYGDLNVENTENKNKINELNAEINKLKETNRNLQSMISNKSSANQETQKSEQINSYSNDEREIQERRSSIYDDRQSECQELSQQLNKSNQLVEFLRQENEKLKPIIFDYQQTITELNKTISVQDAGIRELTSKSTQLNKTISELSKTISSRNNEITKLKETNEQLQNKSKANKLAQKTIDDLQTKNNKLAKERDDLQIELVNLCNKIKELEVQNKNLQTEHETKMGQFKTESEKQISQLRTQIGELEGEITLLNSQINNLNDQISQLTSDKSQLEIQASELEEKFKQQTVDFTNTKIDLEDSLKKLKEKANTGKENPKEFTILDVETIDNFQIIEEIGFGGFGRVFKIEKCIKNIYALKTMNKKYNNEIVRSFINEYEIMNMTDHPSILKTFGIFFGDDKRPPSIVLEFCPQNINDAIQNNLLSKEKIVCSIYEIAEGMRYLHFRNIVHRDLKPSNILISSDGTIRIGDFGISKLILPDEQTMTLIQGTQKFTAPEIINEKVDYNEKVDVYSFGVLVFVMLNNGCLPRITITQIGNGEKAEIPSNFTDFSKDLINKCWNFKADERPSFKTICEDIENNNFELIPLSEEEKENVRRYIIEYKNKIPLYND